jgi:hypothetical protein
MLIALLAAAPAQAALGARATLDRSGQNQLVMELENTGDENIISVDFISGTPGITFTNARPTQGICSQSPSTTGFQCAEFSIPPGGRLTVVVDTNPEYPDNGGGRVEVRGVDGSGPASFNTTGPGPLGPPGGGESPPPVAGQTERVEVVTGTVLVRLRGQRRFVRLTNAQTIPDGSEIDTTNGTLRLTVASNRTGGVSTALVSEGRAIIDQNNRAQPTTTLRLSERLTCTSRSQASGRRRRQGKRRRKLFVNTPGGKFRTRGRYAAGTVTGTQWRTIDTCTSTTFALREGSLSIRDFVERETVNLRAPRRYVARKARR